MFQGIKVLFLLITVLLGVSAHAQQVITENGRAYKLHTVEKGEGLYRLSVNNNISQEEIIAANPELKTQGLVVGMTLRIPLKTVNTSNQVPVASSANYSTHIVAKGETAYSISKQYEMSLADFYSMNPSAQGGLSEGQAVKVKSKSTTPSAYRIHVIQAGETLYRIGVKYGVKAEEIVAVNPVLDVNAMSVGSLLRIPDTEIPVEDNYFYYHHISAGETLFSLGVKYNVPQEKITTMNPDINWSSLQVGQIVAVPKIGVKKVTYTTHEVQKRETLYGITKQYGITEDQLAEANPGVAIAALQKGQMLNIPHYEVVGEELPATLNPLFVGSSNVEFNDAAYNYESEGRPVINLGLMLPFDSEAEMSKLRMARQENAPFTYKSYRYIEFFQGVKMAADSMSSQGVNVHLKVYDTSNKMTLATLSQSSSLDCDLIIGPAKGDEMHAIAQMAQINKIPVVLPFAQMDSTIKDNPYLFQASVIDSVTTNIVADQIVKACEGKNVILLTCSTKSKLDQKRYDRIRQQLKAKGIVSHQIAYDASKSSVLLEKLSLDQENVLLMPTTSEAQINSVIVAVAGVIDQKKEAKVSLYGLGEWLTFQTIEVDVFHKLNTQIFTTFAIDYSDKKVNSVLSKYRKEYFAEPVAFTPYFQKNKGMSGYSEYALWGYDIAMKFLSAYKQQGASFIRKINDSKIDLVQSNFKFAKLTNWGGQVNVGLRKVTFAPNNDIIVENID